MKCCYFLTAISPLLWQMFWLVTVLSPTSKHFHFTARTCHTIFHSDSFFPRSVNLWNKLPWELQSQSLNIQGQLISILIILSSFFLTAISLSIVLPWVAFGLYIGWTNSQKKYYFLTTLYILQIIKTFTNLYPNHSMIYDVMIPWLFYNHSQIYRRSSFWSSTS